MALVTGNLGSQLAVAAEAAADTSWSAIRSYAIPEFQKIAQTMVDIESGLQARPPLYTQESAAILFRMQLRASQMVLTATTGMILIAVERLINAALSAVAAEVNRAVGFALVAP